MSNGTVMQQKTVIEKEMREGENGKEHKLRAMAKGAMRAVKRIWKTITGDVSPVLGCS